MGSQIDARVIARSAEGSERGKSAAGKSSTFFNG